MNKDEEMEIQTNYMEEMIKELRRLGTIIAIGTLAIVITGLAVIISIKSI